MFAMVFSQFDKNADGKITKKELGGYLREQGQNPSDEELEMMIKLVDVNGNNAIDFSEFLTMMAQLPQ